MKLVIEKKIIGYFILLCISLISLSLLSEKLVILATSIALASILIILFLWNTLFHMTIKPLRNITSSMDKIANGDYNLNISENSKNELVAKLGISINKVMSSVQAANKETEESAMNLALGLSDAFAVLRKIADGDLTVKMQTTNVKDEAIAKLGEIINKTCDNLNSIVEQAYNASQQLASSSNEILATSQELARTTEVQASSLTEIISTINETAAAAAQLSHSGQSISSLVQNSAKTLETGTRMIGDTLAGMTRIKESNQGTAGRLSLLNEKAEHIDKVVDTIINVADQTNLLSLNAAIEAAKAGEQGKGFAVVAQEIRKLADQTNIASQEISNMINEIKAAINTSVMSMEKSSEDVRVGTEMVDRTGVAFKEIITNNQMILPQIEAIVSAVGQQAESTKQINIAAKQTEEGVNMVASSTKQAQISANELNKTAIQLREIVGKFKLNTSK